MQSYVFAAFERDLANLIANLETVRREAEQQKAAALKSVEELAAEQKIRVASEKRIAEIEEDLKSATTISEALKASISKDATELGKLKVDCQETTTQ